MALETAATVPTAAVCSTGRAAEGGKAAVKVQYVLKRVQLAHLPPLPVDPEHRSLIR